MDHDFLMHYGTPRHSGRYPWGSGDKSYQRTEDFLSRIDELKKKGMSDTDIAKSFNLSTTQYRVQKSLAKDERRSDEIDHIKSLKSDGHSTSEIGKMLGKNESSIRSLLNQESEEKMNETKNTANFLKEQIKKKGMIDVGIGVERELGISKEKMNQALYMLQLDGFEVYKGSVPQVNNKDQRTHIQVACPPGTKHSEIYDYSRVNSISNYTSHDNGKTFDSFTYPKSMDINRLKINYKEDGGINKDGLIEIRRGCKDLDLGNSHYAQVRILVDNDRYLKGMAIYSDDLPKGVDVMFNTNKSKSIPKREVLKGIKDDPDNPFGSLIKANGQSYYTDKNGKKQLSLINKRAEEGDWGSWGDKLPSQFLGKQSKQLIKKQLKISSDDKQAELDEILALNNPTVKKKMLDSFASDCDSAAVHLKAAALPRQKYQVIIPVPKLKDTEVYAPNYENGEKVALIRYPHGGTFEIPILTVNNKQLDAKKTLGSRPIDAIGINSKVAGRLSGADFDGDTVMVIPTKGNGKNLKVDIQSTPPLKGLEGFDPKDKYPEKPGMKVMKNTGVEMGKISNLITDMTLKGATDEELARAVRHSMVVIDAEKHHLDYKKSEKDNDIAALKKKYQGHINENGKYSTGASTLLSRATAQTHPLKRKGSPKIDPETGENIYKEVREEYVNPKTGKITVRTRSSTQMADTKNPYSLSSGTPQEEAYAEYASKMKILANTARKEIISTGKIEYSPDAKEKYAKEVSSLNSSLNISLKNKPKERQAQLIANSVVAAKVKDNPDMTNKEKQKIAQQALSSARANLGAESTKIHVSDKEWEAIQAGAISENKLKQIIDHVDADELKQRATPRSMSTLSEVKKNRINTLTNSSYTTNEIANAIGVPVSVVRNYLSEQKGGSNG